MKRHLSAFSVLAALSLFGFSTANAGSCPLSQAGQAISYSACGTLDAQADFHLDCSIDTGNTLYGVTATLDANIQKYTDGKTLVCFESCAVEGDIDVKKITAVLPATPENCAKYSQPND